MLPTVQIIVEAVANVYGCPVDDIMGRDRHRTLAEARQVAIYLVRSVYGSSLHELARHFDRDHTTVIAACRAVERHLLERPLLRRRLAEISSRLTEPAPVPECLGVEQ